MLPPHQRSLKQLKEACEVGRLMELGHLTIEPTKGKTLTSKKAKDG